MCESATRDISGGTVCVCVSMCVFEVVYQDAIISKLGNTQSITALGLFMPHLNAHAQRRAYEAHCVCVCCVAGTKY